MFETSLEELDLAEAALLGGMDPFVLRDRLLIRLLKGRCCFDIGLAMKCFEGTIEIKEGRRDGLELSAASNLIGVKITTEYEFERSIEYGCGICDSVAPVLVFDEAYIQVWEVRVGMTAGLWKRNETIFIPTKRPFVASNKVIDDPECGCARSAPPTGGPEDQISLALEEMVTRLISSQSLTPPPEEEELPEPTPVVNEALVVLQQVIQPVQTERPERVGLMNMHGGVSWFSGVAARGELPQITLISTDCNASVRNRLAVVAEQEHFPVLAVTPAPSAAWGRLSLAIEEAGRGLVHYEDWDIAVASETASVAWATIDFRHFGAGDSGQIKLELFDSNDSPIAQPLTEDFVVVMEPAISGRLITEPVKR